jgi:3-dehydroquinate dehydratase/shikimate dehydrogenase
VTLLCVSLTEKSTDSMLAAMHSLPRAVDIVELRIDTMEECDLPRLCGARDRPLIVTNRAVREGGGSNEPESQRLARLREAARLGAEYVDVEVDSAAELGPLPGGTARIVSFHDPHGTPQNLPAVLRRVLDTNPDVAKIVATACSADDLPPILDLLRRHGGSPPLIALSMGEDGFPSRVLAARFGAFLTFASPHPGRESAPGQMTYRQMLDLYRAHRVDAHTRVYGVIADPVAHSMSPAVHNASFAALGLNAVYLPFRVVDPARFLEGFVPLGLEGASVTVPHKEAALRLMDHVDPLAQTVGAVNTVHVRPDGLYGCNTDVAAAVGSVERAVARAGLQPLQERHVLLVGAGGAGRAFGHGLRGKVGRLTIANRTAERGRTLAAELGARFCSLGDVADLRPDVLINATSVGMWPHVDRSPVPPGMLRKGMVVFDSVYNPPRTRLLQDAERAGAVPTSGVEWFVDQAAAQFELWTGADAPREVMYAAVMELLGSAA